MPQHSSNKGLFIFIGIWVAFALLQAALLGVDADEAYYWLLSQNLDWGYFDHPPFVTLAIRIGESFGHSAFLTRLVTVLTSAGTIYFGFKMLPYAWRNVKTYLLVFASIVMFHLYSFITTPDAFLLFFTVLFFYRYKKYVETSTIANTILLALSITGLLYSKYHGVLPVLFTFLSNPRLALKPSAWAVIALVLAAFSPHLYWQYMHGWPTVRYHLSERISSAYKLSKTTDYIIAQAFIWGPLTTLPALYFFIKKKFVADTYLRAHYFTFFGVLLFFLFSSFRSSIEAHWTLAAGPSFVVLLHAVVNAMSFRFRKTFFVLLYINVALIIIARLLLLLPMIPIENISGLKAMVQAEPWADSLYSKAAGQPVVFPDSYSAPALYRFYHPTEQAIGYNTTNYRKTNFNISDDESRLNNKTVYLIWSDRIDAEDIAVNSAYMNSYLHRLDSFKSVNRLRLEAENLSRSYKVGDPVTIDLTLSNDGKDSINAKGLSISYVVLKTRKEQTHSPITLPIDEGILPPSFSKKFVMPLQLPKEKGSYTLIYSIVQPPFVGTFASPFYKVEVN